VSRPLKFAFALSHIQYYRHFDAAIRQLCMAGNEVRVVTDRYDKPNLTDRAIQSARAELSGISFEKPLGRRDVWKYLIRPIRELINYAIYFRPGHPSPSMARLWRQYFPRAAWMILRIPAVGRFLASNLVYNTLRKLEPLIPPSAMVLRWLKEYSPDVVVVSPLLAGRSTELEYLKAAKALKIPALYALASWDNLTTKGTMHVQPDVALVWNEALREEAANLHGVPREDIVVTGSPTFDYWFEMLPSRDRDEFCAGLEMRTGQQYVVYLCTSRGMIEDEESLILDLASELLKNDQTRDLMLLVRPHPYNELKLERLQASNIRVFPRGGEWPDVDEAKQMYFDTLHYAKATIGINTTAMIESAIVDIPCVTIIDERYRSWQVDMGHFWHLMNGDFLQVEYSYASAVDALGQIMQGEDVKCEQRRRFVRDFVRPNGMQIPANRLFCQAVTMAAQGRSASEITSAIQGGGDAA
jgi:hypothetical protein